MRKTFTTIMLTAMAASASYSTLAHAAPSAADILSANQAASGGKAWDAKAALRIEYAYSGQGMTGKVTSLDDLNSGRWMDDAAIGPATQSNGYDGTHAWQKDTSGTTTVQDGGDQRPLAINEGYRRANMWWRANFGGAAVVADGEKTDAGSTFDVLTITPKDGKNFDAWFDAKTHLLARIVELQGTETFTSTLSDYHSVGGAEIAYKTVVTNGTVKYDQTLTATAASFLPAQPDSALAMPVNKVADFSIAGGAAQTTIPFELINNHIYAHVSVNGKPFLFIFDTGGVNVVTPPTAKTLGLKSEGHIQGNGAGEGHMDFGLTKIESLQVGDATIKDQVFMTLALDALYPANGVEMRGMVGYETFRRFVTRVDYGAGTLTLIDPKHFDPKDAGAAIPFTFYGNNINAAATYNGHPGNFTIDTGSRVSLTLNGPFAKANLPADGSEKSVKGVTGWGIGGPSHAIAMYGESLTIGPYTIKKPIAEISTDKGGAFFDASIAGNIGAGILKRYVVTLDYEHTTMYLKPVSGPIADLDTFDHAGMWINEDADGFKVIDVMKGAPAESAGLKVGDIITAVDGKPVKDLHLYDLRRTLRNDTAGTTVNFAVKDGAATRDVKVTLKDLI